ncbi:hypothetical protein E2C01_004283 [Portunus trituberculatus]|uniref:Uncharacterized protein n=1 Tax=Portunus trituberculatus TaxID=210409 RepID=A0A5B7CVZ7_PORTR|nr:hypothetical protein [Portunus trituberculatus]
MLPSDKSGHEPTLPPPPWPCGVTAGYLRVCCRGGCLVASNSKQELFMSYLKLTQGCSVRALLESVRWSPRQHAPYSLPPEGHVGEYMKTSSISDH